MGDGFARAQGCHVSWDLSSSTVGFFVGAEELQAMELPFVTATRGDLHSSDLHTQIPLQRSWPKYRCIHTHGHGRILAILKRSLSIIVIERDGLASSGTVQSPVKTSFFARGT